MDAYIPDTTTYVFVSPPPEETAAVPEPAVLVPVLLVVVLALVLGLRCDDSNTAGNDTAMLLASWRCDISIVLTVFVRTDHQYDVKWAICNNTITMHSTYRCSVVKVLELSVKIRMRS
jgi:hypothetical protein